MTTVLVTGGTGFIGRHLTRELQADGWQVEVLTRDVDKAGSVLAEGIRAIGSLEAASQPSAVVNLAGENLADGRWTTARKQEMRDSRLSITQDLVSFIGRCETPPGVLVSGSAVGYYGARGDEMLDESKESADEFQSHLCADWEAEAMKAEAHGVRVCRVRTGIVLGRDEGALAQMITPFKFGLGGHFGSGKQYMPWIHLADEIGAIRFLIDNASCRGPFNLSAPHPATNREFTDTLARVLKRPSFARVPGPMLKLMLGEMSHLLLTGQRAVPSALEKAGYMYRQPQLEPALSELVGR